MCPRIPSEDDLSLSKIKKLHRHVCETCLQNRHFNYVIESQRGNVAIGKEDTGEPIEDDKVDKGDKGENWLKVLVPATVAIVTCVCLIYFSTKNERCKLSIKKAIIHAVDAIENLSEAANDFGKATKHLGAAAKDVGKAAKHLGAAAKDVGKAAKHLGDAAKEYNY